MNACRFYLPKLFLLQMTLKIGRNSEHIADLVGKMSQPEINHNQCFRENYNSFGELSNFQGLFCASETHSSTLNLDPKKQQGRLATSHRIFIGIFCSEIILTAIMIPHYYASCTTI